MLKINPSEYPKNKEWDEKVFSMPNIPRGNKGQINTLREILELVRNKENKDKKLTFEGSKSKITLDEACTRLRPMKIVKKSIDGWTLPKTSVRWLDAGDNLYLASLLCANIRFFGEILSYLDEPRTAAQLQVIANSDYDMNWKTTSGLNIRLVWLRELNLINFQHFSLEYSITNEGKEFLKNIKVVEASKITRIFDETIDEESIDVSSWALEYLKDAKESSKRDSIGYIPGNILNVRMTILDTISVIRSGMEYNSIKEHISKKYNIAISSANLYIKMLIDMHFVKRKTDSILELTDLAVNWMQKSDIIDFIVCLNASHKFILELLAEIKSESKSYKELAVKSKLTYAFHKENIGEIRKRISILKLGKLVLNSSADRYVLTKRGENLLELLPNLKAVSIQNKQQTGVIQNNKTDALISEIRLSSTDSFNPKRFEKAVAEAMKAIGFNAELFGGAGYTDVYIEAPGAPNYSFSVTVDAKATNSGSVTDGIVDFDTLKEHKRKHGANYIALVGCAFKSDRLLKRAAEHNVVLIDIDSMEKLIKIHNETPIMVSVYKKIFEQQGLADLSSLEEDIVKVKRSGALMKAIMECLLKESKDKITKGFLQERDIYRSLRDNNDFEEGIELDEILAMLSFLSSPFIGCLGKDKDYFYAIGSLEDASKKFNFFARECNSKQ